MTASNFLFLAVAVGVGNRAVWTEAGDRPADSNTVLMGMGKLWAGDYHVMAPSIVRSENSGEAPFAF